MHAVDVPTTSTLVGEAKTRIDLERDHTRRQVNAFLKYLAVTPRGVFVLAVPLEARATARRLIVELNAPFANAGTRLVVIDASEALEH